MIGRQSRQFVGEVLCVADAEQPGARVVPQAPGRKADRGQMRLQVARRQIDDHAPAAAGADCLELCGEDVLVPAQRELAAGIELAKALLRKACKIGAQQRGVLAHIMGFGRGHCGLSLPVRSGGECP